MTLKLSDLIETLSSVLRGFWPQLKLESHSFRCEVAYTSSFSTVSLTMKFEGDQIKGMPYFNALFLANLESLKDRRNKISRSFFKKILFRDSCLHSLLPPERNTEVLSKLRNHTKYPIPHSRTKRYQSFLNYALAHYQK